MEVSSPGGAVAAPCEMRTLGETTDSIIAAATARSKALGVLDISFVAPLEGNFRGRMYVMSGSHVSMAVADDGGLAREVRFALSQPFSAADRDVQASMAAFLVARLSSQDERDVRSKIFEAEEQQSPGGIRPLTYPNHVVAIVKKTKDDDLLLSIRQADCK